MFKSARNLNVAVVTNPHWLGAFHPSPCLPHLVQLGPLAILCPTQSPDPSGFGCVTQQAYALCLFGRYLVRNSYRMWSFHKSDRSAAEALLAA